MNHATLLRLMLEELGGTADAVAGTLKEIRIPTTRSRNPLVRYLQSQLRVDASLDVQNGRLRLSYQNGNKAEVVLPQAVRQFLARFDRGDYPELELPPPAPS